jgi:hypothetical protein
VTEKTLWIWEIWAEFLKIGNLISLLEKHYVPGKYIEEILSESFHLKEQAKVKGGHLFI